MLVPIVVLIVLLLLNGVFAMSELAMMTSRQSRLQQAAQRGNRRAATALALAREPTRLLSTVQVGITLIGIFAGAYGERAVSADVEAIIAGIPALARWSDTIAMVIVVLGITYFTLVFGELVPKRLALAHPEAIATLIARPLDVLSRIAAAPVKLLTVSTEAVVRLLGVKPRPDDVSEEDVKSIMGRAASTGVFDPHEHALFQRVFRVGDLTVEALMVPRSDIVWIDERTTLDELRVLIGTSPYSHFPVCRGRLDEIIGVVHIKDLIAYGLLAGREFEITAVANQPMFVPETMPALKLLNQFRMTRNHVAFVVDEYGGTQGLLTMNDIVSALVGDISREGEASPPGATQRDDGSWLLDGRMQLHEAVITLGLPPELEGELSDVNTVAGLLLTLLGRLPREGESAEWHGWRFEVVDMDGARVDQVLAQRVAPEGG